MGKGPGGIGIGKGVVWRLTGRGERSIRAVRGGTFSLLRGKIFFGVLIRLVRRWAVMS